MVVTESLMSTDAGLESLVEEDKVLASHLVELGCYESELGLCERRRVLQSLNLLLKQFMQSVSLSHGVHWQDLHLCSSGRVVAYGSLKLGTAHKGADIDALCIVPHFVTREDFFTSFYRILDHLPEVTELRAIEEAYVPVIKMKYEDIEVDLTFARLNVEQVPEDDRCLLDFPVSSLDARSARSLNGYRSNQALLEAVPNAQVFRVVLRAVKLWAKSQGLYSNTLGFLGGFSWALLVAKACIQCEGLSARDTLLNFFQLFSQWPWPKPVVIKPLANNDENKDGTVSSSKTVLIKTAVSNSSTSSSSSSSSSLTSSTQQASHLSLNYNLPQVPLHSASSFGQGFGFSMSSWNPERNVSERHHVMPIITPSFPHQNSTFNVSLNTRTLIVEKMKRALIICKAIVAGEDEWKTLFKTDHVIFAYDHFLWIVASAIDHVQWFGLIESKIRYFISNVEKECSDVIKSARIWPRPFTKKGDNIKPTNQLWIIGLEYCARLDPSVNPDISRALSDFRGLLESHSRKFRSREMRLEAKIVGEDAWKCFSPTDIQEIIESHHPTTETVTAPVKMERKKIEASNTRENETGQKGDLSGTLSGDLENKLSMWESGRYTKGRSQEQCLQELRQQDRGVTDERCNTTTTYSRSEVSHDIKQGDSRTAVTSTRLESERRQWSASRMSAKFNSQRGNFFNTKRGSHHRRMYSNNNYRDFNYYHQMPAETLALNRKVAKPFTATPPPPFPLLKRSRSTSGASNSSTSNYRNTGTGNHFDPPQMPLQHSSSSASLMTHIFSSPPPSAPDLQTQTNNTEPIGTPDRWSVSSNGSYPDNCDYDGLSTCGSAVESTVMDIYPSCEMESVRTVSLTSDKFPPQALVQARIQSGMDRVPYSPSTPPPPFFTTRSNHHQLHSSSSSSFMSLSNNHPIEQAQPKGQPKQPTVSTMGRYYHQTLRPRSKEEFNPPRAIHEPPLASIEDFKLCSSPGEELRDLSTPRPVEHFHYQPLTINLSTSKSNNNELGSTSRAYKKVML